MKILITNDDGILAPGLHALIEVARRYGEVKVVAPDRERSACGHSMTMRDPLRVWPVHEYAGIEAYQVNGVPTDCVNLGLSIAWPNGCDLILSGINNGPNLGFDVTYSGTVAAAMEGAINDIRSIAISMALFVTDSPIHYATGAEWLAEYWDMLVDVPNKPLTFLNVNVPNVDYLEIRGHKVAQMGRRVYKDRIEYREDPWGRPYYWQGGVVAMSHNQPGTDVEAVSDGFVSITPITLDWTDHDMAEQLEKRFAHPSKGEAVSGG